jgi:four helix bundle protein
MRRDAFQEKALDFGLRLMELLKPLGDPPKHYLLLGQLRGSGLRLGAKYANIISSGHVPIFCAQLRVVEALVEETICWLEMLDQRQLAARGDVQELLDEAGDMAAIIRRSLAAAQQRRPD